MKSYFDANGVLAQQIDGYSPRPIQLQMATAIADAIEAQETLAVEAGTGTGKTFAYLVPSLLSGKRVVVSTGTLNLQDQLFGRDLPRIRDALQSGGRIALLKGRANYFCLHRLEVATQVPAGRQESERVRKLREWLPTSKRGEIQEQDILGEGDPLIPRVTSTAENCLGTSCPDFEECFVVKARRAAQSAQLLVVNHHLLFADFMLKEEGFGQVLPGADAVIVDEAHQLPEIASRFFGLRLSTRQLQELAGDVATIAGKLRDVPELRNSAAAMGEAIAALERSFAAIRGSERFELFRERRGVVDAVDGVDGALDEMQKTLEPVADRDVEIASARGRALEMRARLSKLTGRASEGQVAWVEAFGRGGAFNATPVSVASDFQRLRDSHAGAWVFTSATLATGEDFSHFLDQLGLEGARTLRLDSPFDFASQARLYLPAGLPNPNEPGYSEKLSEEILPLIEASGGGAFVLCTSHRALRAIAAALRAALEYEVLVQGEGSRTELLRRFAASGNAILVGTASFWEGVDVRGLALRLVVIDRIPFAAPGDPVFDARLAAIREAGGEPFRDYQLPEAVTSLRQGVGRLIRDVSDRGLLVLCDPRLRSKPYGKKLLRSLPQMPLADSRDEAMRWLQEIRLHAEAAVS